MNPNTMIGRTMIGRTDMVEETNAEIFLTREDQDSWLADSGASLDICTKKYLFKELQEGSSKGINEKDIKIKGNRTVKNALAGKQKKKLTLSNVAFVPDDVTSCILCQLHILLCHTLR